MADLQHAVPGQPFVPRANDWNAFIDAARVVRDARTIFGVPRLDAGGGGNAELLPYIITQTATPNDPDGDNIAIYRNINSYLVSATFGRKAQQPFAKWEIIDGLEDEALDRTLMRGVVFTGQVVLVSANVTGHLRESKKTIVGGWGGDNFHECVTVADIEAGNSGQVKLRYLDAAGERREATVDATNTLNRGLSANQVCTLVTFCDALQRFQIISASCEYEEVS